MSLPWCSSYLLDLAKDDLCAARILYEHGLVAHSLFWLSQAVEKAVKSLIALRSSEDFCSKLKSLGHEPFYREVRKELQETAQRLRCIGEALKRKELRERIATSFSSKLWKDLVKLLESDRILSYADGLEHFIKVVEELHSARVRGAKGVEQIINNDALIQYFVSVAREVIDELSKVLSDERYLEGLFRDQDLVRHLEEFMREYIEKMRNVLPSPKAEQLNRVRGLAKAFTETAPSILLFLIRVVSGGIPLSILQLLFESCNIATLARYPEEPGLGPKELNNTALANHIPTLLEIATIAIETLNKAIQQLQEMKKKLGREISASHTRQRE